MCGLRPCEAEPVRRGNSGLFSSAEEDRKRGGCEARREEERPPTVRRASIVAFVF